MIRGYKREGYLYVDNFILCDHLKRQYRTWIKFIFATNIIWLFQLTANIIWLFPLYIVYPIRDESQPYTQGHKYHTKR